MKRRSLWLLSIGVEFGAALILVVVLATPASAPPQDKVTICHATSSVGNPYVQNTVNENSVVKPNGEPTGHGTHTGPVYPQPDWGDIIPPFEYTNDHGGTSTYPGLNWATDGQAIWNGGCLVDLTPPIEPPEESTTTTTGPEVTTTTSGSTTTTSGSTTTTSGSTTTSSSAPGSTTSQPGSTTTTLPPTTTPTTAPPNELPPPVTDPGMGVETMPPTEAVAVVPGGRVVDLGMLSDSQRVALEAIVDASAPPTTTTQLPAPLAGTGMDESTMVATATLLMLAGGLLYMGSRRMEHRKNK